MDYPIPPVSREDFMTRFDEVLDDKLIQLIAESDIDQDWSDVGWRGIMLNHGVVWVDFDDKITHFNYTTDIAKALRAKLIADDRAALHVDLQDFDLPISAWTTSKYRMRIDQLNDGSYRFSRWMKGAAKSTIPELALSAGKIHYEGSGGNHSYVFIDVNMQIVCRIYVIGKDDSPIAEITVLENGKAIESYQVLRPNN